MQELPERPRSQSDSSRASRRLGVCGVLGALVLGLVGIGLLGGIAFAVFSGDFIRLAVCVGAVGLTWVLTKRVRVAWLRLLLRAMAFAVFLWPFISHRSIEWSSPWPPAGYLLLTGLAHGELMWFELASILVGTVVMWLAGCAVYRDRHRYDDAADGRL